MRIISDPNLFYYKVFFSLVIDLKGEGYAELFLPALIFLLYFEIHLTILFELQVFLYLLCNSVYKIRGCNFRL